MKYKHIVFGVFLVTFLSCTKAILDESNTMVDEDVKYDPDVKAIMSNDCISCHGGSTPSGGFRLTTYEDVRLYTENRNLIPRINDDTRPMPPSGLLNIEDRQIVQKWADDGFPEN